MRLLPLKFPPYFETEWVELVTFNPLDSRLRKFMNTKNNAMTVRMTPNTRNPPALNVSPITMLINNEERMVHKYLDVLNRPEATPMISFGELLNRAACIPTLFKPLLMPNAAKAKHTLTTGEF